MSVYIDDLKHRYNYPKELGRLGSPLGAARSLELRDRTRESSKPECDWDDRDNVLPKHEGR